MLLNDVVYLLEHSYETADGCDHIKTLGIFSSQENAENAIQKYKELPGFREFLDGFFVDKYELDKREWIEVFVYNKLT